MRILKLFYCIFYYDHELANVTKYGCKCQRQNSKYQKTNLNFASQIIVLASKSFHHLLCSLASTDGRINQKPGKAVVAIVVNMLSS